MLIDFHAHVFSDKIAGRAIEVLQKQMKEAGLAKNLEKIDYAVCYDGTENGLREFGKANGVDLFVTLPIATKEKQTDTINRFARSITGGNILSFGSIYPGQHNWESILDELSADGIKGIKLHPEFQNFEIDSRKSVELLKKAEQLGLIVVIHAGEDEGYVTPVKCTPKKLYNVLQEVRGANIVAAHMGGSMMWDDVEKYLVGTPLYFDTAFVSHVLDKTQCLRIIRNHGVDKILFGSDIPWESPTETVEYLNSIGLTTEELDSIYYKNALRLLEK